MLADFSALPADQVRRTSVHFGMGLLGPQVPPSASDPASSSETLPARQVELEIVVADPITAERPFSNSEELSGKLILTKRGAATFASIVKRAAECGAGGVIVLNHVDVWPYLMRDTKGEMASLGTKGVPPFLFMVPRAGGEVRRWR
jgi:hypothetical protein